MLAPQFEYGREVGRVPGVVAAGFSVVALITYQEARIEARRQS